MLLENPNFLQQGLLRLKPLIHLAFFNFSTIFFPTTITPKIINLFLFY